MPGLARRARQPGAALAMALAVALSAVLALAALPGSAGAADPIPWEQPSGYTTFKGEPFFLLSDATRGSNEVASVRLEVPGRDMARASLEAYSGVDIVVYRVPQPLEFLKKQRNLHRIEVAGNYQGEGLANTLRYLWDSWWKKSRLLWRRIFTGDARRAVTETHPALRTDDAIGRPTVFAHHPQYKPLKGFEMVDSFRYPVWQARPIEPPKGVKLEGSSSDFLPSGGGNLMIPVGQRKPGLYLVEAIIGEHRATTLVFVSDTMAVTKVSSNQMLVWSARRDNGAAVAGTRLAWSDGTGILQSGATDAAGIAVFERGSPEHTYVIGEDKQGGVFVSENYYYDSEIYNTKVYAVTDRPLYRPGDEVNVKFLARDFKSARVSQPAAAGPVELSVIDPNGTPVLTQRLQLSPDSGSEARFRLPESAGAGGYELRFSYQDGTYGAAFRVAEYVKPHFEIDVRPAKPEFKTGETVKGSIALRYPDGKPVRRAAVALSLRSQQNTMVEGELRYGGLFPVELKTQELTTDNDGNVDFTLPAATQPSRYIVTLLATDGAAYRVKTTRELLIERASASYRLSAARQFSDPGQRVHFDLVPENAAPPSTSTNAAAAAAAAARPTRWEMVRLETQTRTAGDFDPAARGWDVSFPQAGSYQLSLRDARGNLVAAASHWVSGDGVRTTPGSIEIVLDRARYAVGDTAEALVTFSEPADQALVTLERDKVEHHGLVTGGADWFSAQRVAPRQWRVRIPVREDYGPNMTFSVASVRRGDFVFENAGLQIAEPRIALQFKADKDVYQPGEKVTLDVSAQLDGKPVSTLVTLGVVDEMIYVLQPEIAPPIDDFFYHPRRNNVRTTASLSFISYDVAQGRGDAAPARHNYNERGVKVLERPRRDDVDTALWAPSLRTDASGRARVSFTMPDALTRWRITGRAMDAQGRVGQRTAYLRSDKAFYAKWTAPDWMRAGDAPRASVALFNQSGKEQALALTLLGGPQPQALNVAAKPGVNYAEFALPPNAGALRLEVRQDGRLVDALDTPLATLPAGWSGTRTQVLPLAGQDTALQLPADARDVRVTFASDAAGHFARIVDDLIAYPYGCVEQTASRLIPLAMALQSVGNAGSTNAPAALAVRGRLGAMLQSQRLRLVAMAGPQATFGWWGNGTRGDALMTAYAYYADWLAARALRIELPPEHWNNVLAVYQEHGLKQPLLDRALVLWLAHEMDLPTQTLAAGLVDEQAKTVLGNQRGRASANASLVLGAVQEQAAGKAAGANADAMGLALLGLVAAQNGATLPAPLQQQVDAARQALLASPAPVAQALLVLGGQLPVTRADAILAAVRAEMPTVDRALTLVWLQKKLGGAQPAGLAEAALDGDWRRQDTRTGLPAWRWNGKGVPERLRLAQAALPATLAVVEYESRAPEAQSLPVGVERRILRMQRDKDGYRTEPVKAGEALRTDELYMDEITLKPPANANYRFGLLEVALPPGATVEGSTWGIKLLGGKEPVALERARHVERRDGYAVPVDALAETVTVRHLLRFAQKGRYVLPPARFYRMYQPDQKAFEDGGKTMRQLAVE
ncbi:alpha-2-macroglobulin family protein [Massilia forsythiae]|uniref:Alpha-2-macroglobulin family protein n=1 Tax=Massilia forsythiae TaxID=2728020 RepID=A0A7Z2VYL6_9BURK|nr:alpha-2-macroglobulin [Massilia forsythiae]QJE01817.1 alpha-2-macroglobulin family protein [Massilia forsythiae]